MAHTGKFNILYLDLSFTQTYKLFGGGLELEKSRKKAFSHKKLLVLNLVFIEKYHFSGNIFIQILLYRNIGKWKKSNLVYFSVTMVRLFLWLPEEMSVCRCRLFQHQLIYIGLKNVVKIWYIILVDPLEAKFLRECLFG